MGGWELLQRGRDVLIKSFCFKDVNNLTVLQFARCPSKLCLFVYLFFLAVFSSYLTHIFSKFFSLQKFFFWIQKMSGFFRFKLNILDQFWRECHSLRIWVCSEGFVEGVIDVVQVLCLGGTCVTSDMWHVSNMWHVSHVWHVSRW